MGESNGGLLDGVWNATVGGTKTGFFFEGAREMMGNQMDDMSLNEDDCEVFTSVVKSK